MLWSSMAAEPRAAVGQWHFTDVTRQAGFDYSHGYVEGTEILAPEAEAGGVAAGDYDRDGWIDLYVVRGSAGPNLLFRNRGDGTFEEVGAAAGVALIGAFGAGPTFADVDGDGWLDLLVLGLACPPRFSYCPPASSGARTFPTLFRNRGDGTFEDVTAASGIRTTRDSYSAAFGDYDLDGDLDLFLTHWGDNRDAGSSEHLWRNRGDGTFEDVSDSSGLTSIYTCPFGDNICDLSFTPNFADIDGDGWPDLLIAGDFHTSKVLHNRRDGTFAEVTTAVISDENGMGAAIGDYDGDGDLDWFVSSIWDPNGVVEAKGAWYASGNRLYRNEGNGVFSDATDQAGVRHGYWGWGSTFADLDDDGDLDLFHVNGWRLDDPDAFEFHADPALLFVSSGDATFAERAAELGIADTGQGRGVVAFDYDRDGDLDLFIADNQQPPRLYRNDGGNAFHSLTVRLRGRRSNSEAVGARVYVTAGGRTQMRELRAGSNFESQDPAEAHFGLGPAEVAERVRVLWPEGDSVELAAVPATDGAPLLITASSEIPTPTATFDTATPTATATASPTPTETEAPTATVPSTPTATSIPDTPTATPTPTARPSCTGDCDADRRVSVDEVIRMVGIALDALPPSACPDLARGDLGVDDLVRAVRNTLDGCGG